MDPLEDGISYEKWEYSSNRYVSLPGRVVDVWVLLSDGHSSINLLRRFRWRVAVSPVS